MTCDEAQSNCEAAATTSGSNWDYSSYFCSDDASPSSKQKYTFLCRDSFFLFAFFFCCVDIGYTACPSPTMDPTMNPTVDECHDYPCDYDTFADCVFS